MKEYILIGQAPGPNTRPEYPLYPFPKTGTGARLATLMGLSRPEYLRRFDRMNLIYSFPGRHKRDDKFPKRDGRVAAEAVRPLLAGRNVLLVGRNVADSFGYVDLPFLQWELEPQWGFNYCCIPHTSGRSVWWRHEENKALAADFFENHLWNPPSELEPTVRR